MSPSVLIKTKIGFLAIFCIFLSLVSSHPAIDGGRLGNRSNFNATTGQSLGSIQRRPSPKEGQSGINNPRNDSQILPDPPKIRLLHFVESGECKQGRIYKIERAEDLRDFGDELECIFFSGLSPSKVPLGRLYGSVLSILEMTEFDGIANVIWSGKHIVEAKCSGRTVNIGWNNILQQSIVPFVGYLSPIKEVLVPGEFNDGKSCLIVDYTQDFSKLCDNFGDLQESLGMNIPGRNIFPINQIVDVLRFVGRQSDGGSILLGKTYLRHSARHWSSTVIYFYLINYDSRVNPEFVGGQELPPLEQSFTYKIPGIGGNAWQRQ